MTESLENVLYSTELLGLPVYDLKRRTLGRVKDAAIVPLVNPLRLDRFLISGGLAWLTVRYDQVRSIGLRGIYLRDEQLTPYHSDEYMLRLKRDLLDQQIINAQGRKVVRVNDVTFDIVVEGGIDTLHVREVDIGIRSIVRRLLQGVVPPTWVRHIQGPIAPHSIPWEYCNIIEPDPQRRLRLNYNAQALEKIHPADLADIVEDLSPEDRGAIFESIDSEVAAETLSEVDPDLQASILESLDAGKAAEIIEGMSPDAAAHALADVEEDRKDEILEEMDPEPKTEVSELLEFEEDTAGGMMNTEYIALPERATVGDAMAAIRAQEELLENLNTLFLIDQQDRLCAAIPLGKLFLAGSDTPLKQLSAEMMIHVNVDESRDRVTELFDKYNLLTLPVTDDEGKLTGTITADDIISVLRNQ